MQVRGWTVTHPSIPGMDALRAMNLRVDEGEILGLGGLMGAGRTALLSTLFGDQQSRCQGELCLGDGPWRPPFKDPSEAIQAGLCLVSEDRKRLGLVGSATVSVNVALASLARFAKGAGLLDWKALGSATLAQCQSVQVRAASTEVEADTLSGGNQQKLVLARWLLVGPKVLLLDEPTRGIDVGARAEIYALIRGLAAQGMAVILASSDLPELLALSHRIVVLSQGRQSAQLAFKDFSPEAVMHAATAMV
jgi:D-xylose transport system ATP-binding protein